MQTENLKQSPLHAKHAALGATMAGFAGWNMPIKYGSIINEHKAVRQSCGAFDVSHMGQFMVSGAGAAAWLNGVLTNNAATLQPGQAHYSIMLNERGGVIDDLYVYRLETEAYLLVVNASMIEADFAHLRKLVKDGVELRDLSGDFAGIAVQGPKAAEIFAKTLGEETLPQRNGVIKTQDGAYVCRTGYTGEDGFEIFCPLAQASTLWDAFVAAGAEPCGLGARDTLRLESCFPLNGNDLSPARTPLEAGLAYFCDLSKNFIGSDALLAQQQSGVDCKLCAIKMTAPNSPPPRAHYPVLDGADEALGELCSGALSPTLGYGVALAYLPIAYAKVGAVLKVVIRNNKYAAVVVKKPFYRRPQ